MLLRALGGGAQPPGDQDGEPCNASDPEAYVYLACTTPLVRFSLASAAAAEGAFESFALWESYTPLVEGATLAQPSPQLERDPTTGSLVYGWKRGTGALPDDEQAFIARGEMAPDESLVWGATTDAETGDTITLSGGDIQWSEHRQKWVYISRSRTTATTARSGTARATSCWAPTTLP